MGTQREKIQRLLRWGFFAAAFLISTVYMALRVDGRISSDDASEMVLGHLLYEEGRIITPSWFYSTELRVLNIAQVFALWFHFSADWHTVRMLGTVTMYVILCASCWYFCRQFEGLREYAPIYMGILMLPYSMEYCMVVLTGLFYIVHTATTFLTLGLILHIRSLEEGRRGQKRLLCLLLFLLSVGTGLGGLRMIAMLYLPAFAVAVLYRIQKERGLLFPAGLALGGGLLGSIGNMLLLRSGSYHYVDFSNMALRLPDRQRMAWLGVDLFAVLGLTTESGRLAWVLGGLLSVAVVVLLLLLGLRLLRSGRRDTALLSWFVLAIFAFFLGVSLFTELAYDRRYFLQVSVYFFAVLLQYYALYGRSRRGFIAYAVLLLLLTAESLLRYTALPDVNEEKEQIAQALLGQGYDKGYATFFNANILTELTDGQLELWTLRLYDPEDAAGAETQSSLIAIYPWLQRSSHLEQSPASHNFLLLEREEYEMLKKYAPGLVDTYAAESESYVLYLDISVQ